MIVCEHVCWESCGGVRYVQFHQKEKHMIGVKNSKNYESVHEAGKCHDF